MRIALVAFAYYETFAKQAAFDESALLRRAFEGRGVTLEVVPGPSDAAAFFDYDAVLPLGCWGYHKDAAAFLSFVDKLQERGVRLMNPAAVLRWNLDKSYLLDLRDAGVTVAPLLYFPRGSAPDLAAELRRAGWSRGVVKPAVSAGALRTQAFAAPDGEPGAEIRALCREILEYSGLIVQPFFEEIPRHGEVSMMLAGDRLFHAVNKVPKAGDFRSQPDHGGVVSRYAPSPELIEKAQQAVAVAARLTKSRIGYARVDGFLRDGRLELIELELIEPYLFLSCAEPAAAAQFVDGVLAAFSAYADRSGASAAS